MADRYAGSRTLIQQCILGDGVRWPWVSTHSCARRRLNGKRKFSGVPAPSLHVSLRAGLRLALEDAPVRAGGCEVQIQRVDREVKVYGVRSLDAHRAVVGRS